MTDIWLDWVNQVPVTGKGNGEFGNGLPLGWVLHVNQSNGDLDDYFRAGTDRNAGQVCPNFQVYKNGAVHQHLPLNWSPWCQADGNYQYAAIETEGYDYEPLTIQQIQSLGRLHAEYRNHLGVQDVAANSPGQRGIGIHVMGGAAWGGHTCPGTIRTAQRPSIIAASKASSPSIPHTPSKGRKDMPTVYQNVDAPSRPAFVVIADKAVPIGSPALFNQYKDGGALIIYADSAHFADVAKAAGGIQP